MISRAHLWTACALTLAISTARPAAADASKLSPYLQLLAKSASGRTSVLRGATWDSPRDALDLVLRLDHPPTAQERATLRARGVEIAAAATPTGAYLATGNAGALAALHERAWVRSVSSGSVSPFMRLLDMDLLRETRTDVAARTALASQAMWLDGAGTTVGDVDSDAWVFHPSLFRADAGAFAWIDSNGNGTFEPTIDALDLDGDGAFGDGERALPIRVELRDISFNEVATSAAFDAGRDYVYLDQNQNGKRDFGSKYTEHEPAFGEPLFVVDDGNGNGLLDVSERLLRLGTSKFASIRQKGKTFTRGDESGHGIIDYGTKLARNLKRSSNVEHGTYMTSIIAGGRTTSAARGLAPGADIVLVSDPNIADITWLLDQPIVSVSFPIGSIIGEALDGTSELEQLVDAFWKRGIFATVSVGNQSGFQSHASLDASPGQELTLPFEIKYPMATAYLSAVLAGGGPDLELAVTDAAGVPVLAQNAAMTSSRGTKFAVVVVDASNLKGSFVLHVKVAGTGAPGKLHVYSASDNGYPIPFGEAFTDETTLSSPATADESFGATGYVLHTGADYGFEDNSPVGSLAWFASRGPRVDGRALLGLAAPVNPVGATILVGSSDTVAERSWPGTSCSSPQVAAVAALLHQALPNESVVELRDRLIRSARTDSFVSGGPNAWGAGKLDVAAALGAPAVSAAPPTVGLELASQVQPGQPVIVHANATGTGTLMARWDLDYDGHWDTPFEEIADKPLLVVPRGRLAVRIEVHDATGALAGASLLVPIGEATPTPMPTPTPTPSGGGCAVSAASRSAPWSSAFLTVLIAWFRFRRRSAY